MKIKAWKSERAAKDFDVEFPMYTRWVSGDFSDTFNRVDGNGLCLSIHKDIGDHLDGYYAPAFEIKRTKIDLSKPIDGSYVSDGDRTKECTEAQFLKVFDEMIEAVQTTRATLKQ